MHRMTIEAVPKGSLYSFLAASAVQATTAVIATASARIKLIFHTFICFSLIR